MPQTGKFNLASIEGALSAQSPTNLTVGLTILKLVGHRSIVIEITVGLRSPLGAHGGRPRAVLDAKRLMDADEAVQYDFLPKWGPMVGYAD
jgi:hypothetical protein